MNDILNARGRILALLEILTMFTDEYHTLTAEQMCVKLSEYGYDVTKRTVLSDLKVFENSPYNIVKVSREKGYYIINSNSSQAVRKILAASYSSRMISNQDVNEIKQYLNHNACISTLNSVYETTESLTHKLHKKEITFDLVQTIRDAIKTDRRIILTYTSINFGDGYSEPCEEHDMIVNPLKIVISSSNHVLTFTSIKTPKKPEYINLHRITNVTVLDEKQNNDCSDHLKSVDFFSGQPLIAGYEKSVWLFLRFKKEHAEMVDNFFSCPMQFKKDADEDYCLAKVHFTITKDLFGWLYHYRNIIEVVAPAKLRNYFEKQF